MLTGGVNLHHASPVLFGGFYVLSADFVHMCRRCGYVSRSRQLGLKKCHKCKHRMLPINRRIVDMLKFFIACGIKVLDAKTAELHKSGQFKFYLAGLYEDVFQDIPDGLVYITNKSDIYNSLSFPPVLTVTFVDGEEDYVRSILSGDGHSIFKINESFTCEDIIVLLEQWASERDANAIYCMLSLTHRL